MSFIEECRKFIGIESTPSHGNKEAAEFAASLCRDAGLKIKEHRETLNGLEQVNLIARPKGSKSDELLLQTHLDTAEPGSYALWTDTQENPFNASIYEDQLVGLGAADTKLDFLCKLEAVRSYPAQLPIEKSFVLAGTYGAQSGMAGAVKLMRRKEFQGKFALIGEPTDLRLVAGGQGVIVVEISVLFSRAERDYRRKHDLTESSSTQSRLFTGRAAHSSRPEQGDNAVAKMLNYLSRLPEGIAVMDLDGGVSYNSVPESAVLEIDLVSGFEDPIVPRLINIFERVRQVEQDFSNYKDEGFDYPYPTMNLGMIRTFDDQIRMTGICRIPPSVPEAVYQGWMDRIEESCSTNQAVFRIRDYKQPFMSDPEGHFMKSCRGVLNNLGFDDTPSMISANTEASVFSRLGVECLLFGPGHGPGNSHAPNERVRLEDLNKAVRFYQRTIERICQ